MNKNDTRFHNLVHMGSFEHETKQGDRLNWADMTVPHLQNLAKLSSRRARDYEREADSAWSYTGSSDLVAREAEVAADRASNLAYSHRMRSVALQAYISLREEFNFILEGPK